MRGTGIDEYRILNKEQMNVEGNFGIRNSLFDILRF